MIDNLHFPQGPPQGFSSQATTQWDGNPEPIVRELLQNCLDAAVVINCEKAEVEFTIRQVNLNQIPGIQSYRQHFEAAVDQRTQGYQSESEKQVIQRIRGVLDDPVARVLFCRDNGVGLDSERMGGLLTEGNTDKSEGGAGAFGIGHLTAFAGSDLRYVLYAGRSADRNDRHDVVSGHAILASRKHKSGGGRGGHGYWLRGREPTLFDLSPYPNKAPPLLLRELDRLEKTGSVVCMTGFNDFRSSDDPIRAIARVAAKNFLVSISCDRMVVRVRDEDGHEEVVDRDRLGSVLKRDREKKRGEQKGGWLPGAQAYQAWQALEEGRSFELRSGAMVRLLPLDARKGRPPSRVQLFRNGMWITNNADELEPRHFRTCKPFAAVLMIEEGELSRLVRRAEGPEHRGLDRRRLSQADSLKLLHALREIACELRSHAGEEEAKDEFTPEGFAMLDGSVQKKAEKVGQFRPRQSTGSNTATALRRDGEGASTDPRRRKGDKPRQTQGAAPRPGRGVPGRVSFVALRNRSGTVDEIRATWRAPNSGTSATDMVGVRVRVPSGSDETCDSPLSPKWLRIQELRWDGQVVRPSRDDPYEAELPPGSHPDFTIVLADPAIDPNVVDVDLVRRRAGGR